MDRFTLKAPVRWGIVGCGDVTEVKSGPALQLANGSELVAVMRRTAEKARDYAERHRVPRWHDQADRLIEDPEVDAVYVATPPETHLEYALRVCSAGKPCYVEKPMARNHNECLRMVEAFRRSGVPLYVAYYRRGLPRFLEVRDLILSGALGKITGFAIRYAAPRHRGLDPAKLPWRLSARQAGGGLLMDLGSHALDVVDFLLGPIHDAWGVAVNRGSASLVEDVVAAAFRCGEDVPGTGSWNFASDAREDLLRIEGTEARVELSVFGDEPLRVIRADAVEERSLPNPPHIQQPLIQTVVDELLGRGRCASTGESAARTNAVLDRLLEGYYGGREDEFWERPESWLGASR
jgi:predicted dehydrogenase